ATQAFQHDTDLLFSGMMPACGSANIPDCLFSALRYALARLSHRCSSAGYDEPAILSYAISSFCPTSADGLHATLVRNRRVGVRRVGRVLLDAADEIERGVQRLIILRVRRDIGLRAGLLIASGLEVAAQRSLAARVGARLELLRHLLQHLDVGRNALRLDRA